MLLEIKTTAFVSPSQIYRLSLHEKRQSDLTVFFPKQKKQQTIFPDMKYHDITYHVPCFSVSVIKLL